MLIKHNGQFVKFENSFIKFSETGVLWGWGRDESLLLEAEQSYETPSDLNVNVNKEWKTIDVGVYHAVAIAEDGTMWSWGRNANGATGLNTDEGITTEPTQIGTDDDWDQIACQWYSNMAIKQDGTLWSWGEATNFVTIGFESTDNVLVPTQIGSDDDWAYVVGKSVQGPWVLLKNNGTMWACGRKRYIGVNENSDDVQRTLVQINPAESDWAKVAVGDRNLFAIKDNGTLYSCGWNFRGLTGLGIDDSDYTLVMTQIGSDNDWDKIFYGQRTMFAIKTNGTLWGWGANALNSGGQYLLDDVGTDNYSSPIQIGTDANWDSIKGEAAVVGIKTDGTALTWGSNGNFRTGQTEENINQNNFVENPTELPGKWGLINVGQRSMIGITA